MQKSCNLFIQRIYLKAQFPSFVQKYSTLHKSIIFLDMKLGLLFVYARLETGPYYVIGYGGRRATGGGRPHRFPHDNFSSVYRIFTKRGRMIPLWTGKNPIYFGIIRSKVKVTITINIIFDNRVVSAR